MIDLLERWSTDDDDDSKTTFISLTFDELEFIDRHTTLLVQFSQRGGVMTLRTMRGACTLVPVDADFIARVGFAYLDGLESRTSQFLECTLSGLLALRELANSDACLEANTSQPRFKEKILKAILEQPRSDRVAQRLLEPFTSLREDPDSLSKQIHSAEDQGGSIDG